jgi:hypothetical protein
VQAFFARRRRRWSDGESRCFSEPWRELVAGWLDQGVQGTTIHGALCRDHGYTGSYSSVARIVTSIRGAHLPEATCACTGAAIVTVTARRTCSAIDVVQVRAQGVVREVLLPKAWREHGDITRRMLADAQQHVDQVVVRVDVVQPAGHDQALEHTDLLSAQLGPAE